MPPNAGGLSSIPAVRRNSPAVAHNINRARLKPLTG